MGRGKERFECSPRQPSDRRRFLEPKLPGTASKRKDWFEERHKRPVRSVADLRAVEKDYEQLLRLEELAKRRCELRRAGALVE